MSAMTKTDHLDDDLKFLFHRAMLCNARHNGTWTPANPTGFCENCHKEIRDIIETRDGMNILLRETEVCALMRQLHRQPITYEGISGPVVHGLLRRIQSQIGASRYTEYVGGAFPERLKPPESGLNLPQK